MFSIVNIKRKVNNNQNVNFEMKLTICCKLLTIFLIKTFVNSYNKHY